MKLTVTQRMILKLFGVKEVKHNENSLPLQFQPNGRGLEVDWDKAIHLERVQRQISAAGNKTMDKKPSWCVSISCH